MMEIFAGSKHLTTALREAGVETISIDIKEGGAANDLSRPGPHGGTETVWTALRGFGALLQRLLLLPSQIKHLQTSTFGTVQSPS